MIDAHNGAVRLGVTPPQCRALQRLMEQPGRPVSEGDLAVAIFSLPVGDNSFPKIMRGLAEAVDGIRGLASGHWWIREEAADAIREKLGEAP